MGSGVHDLFKPQNKKTKAGREGWSGDRKGEDGDVQVSSDELDDAVR